MWDFDDDGINDSLLLVWDHKANVHYYPLVYLSAHHSSYSLKGFWLDMPYPEESKSALEESGYDFLQLSKLELQFLSEVSSDDQVLYVPPVDPENSGHCFHKGANQYNAIIKSLSGEMNKFGIDEGNFLKIVLWNEDVWRIITEYGNTTHRELHFYVVYKENGTCKYEYLMAS